MLSHDEANQTENRQHLMLATSLQRQVDFTCKQRRPVTRDRDPLSGNFRSAPHFAPRSVGSCSTSRLPSFARLQTACRSYVLPSPGAAPKLHTAVGRIATHQNRPGPTCADFDTYYSHLAPIWIFAFLWPTSSLPIRRTVSLPALRPLFPDLSLPCLVLTQLLA